MVVEIVEMTANRVAKIYGRFHNMPDSLYFDKNKALNREHLIVFYINGLTS